MKTDSQTSEKELVEAVVTAAEDFAWLTLPDPTRGDEEEAWFYERQKLRDAVDALEKHRKKTS